MSKLRFNALKNGLTKLTAISLTLMSLIAPVAQAFTVDTGIAPTVTSVSASPNPFTPGNGPFADIYYTVSTTVPSSNNSIYVCNANVTCTYNNAVRILMSPTDEATGPQMHKTWDGKVNGTVVPGNYQIGVTASNGYGSSSMVANITVQQNGGGGDTTAPTLFVVTPVSTPTTDTTPNFTFNSSEAGTIFYNGDCSSATSSAFAGNNTVTFNTLSLGTHSNCTVQVRDAALNMSQPLAIPSFTVQQNGGGQDITPPSLFVVTPVSTPTTDTTPNFTFNSSEAGTIFYNGDCSSATSSAFAGNNTVTFNNLSLGTHSNCTVQVRDAANNMSSALSVPSFTVQQNGGGQDITPPSLFVVTPVSTPTTDTTPNFTFNSSEAGTIFYNGDCSSATTTAFAGNNTIAFNTLSFGTHSNCTIQVRDAANNLSSALQVPSFTVQQNGGGGDTTAPVLSLVVGIPSPTTDTTPDLTFFTNEAGTIVYNGDCSSNMINAAAGNNTITFNTLSLGSHANCSIQVRDASNNLSAPLNIPSFTIQQSNGGDTTAPTISVVSAVPSPTSDTTPDFTFYSSEPGTILYSGDCASSTTTAVAGNNTVTFFTLSNGTHSNCYIQVRDASNNVSASLQVPSFTVQTGGSNNGAPNITSDYVTRNPFDPNNEDTDVYFTIDMAADVTVAILDPNSSSKTLRTLADNIRKNNSGTYNYTWNGNDKFGDMVGDDTYTYKITACSINDSNLCDTETGTVTVDTNGNNNGNGNDFGDLIDNIKVTNATFNPDNGERAKLCFDILKDNTDITVEVVNGSSVVRTLVDSVNYDQETSHCEYWNGKNKNNSTVNDDVYRFRVKADRSGDHETAYAYTEVDTDGNIIGFPGSDNGNGNNNGYCAGFTDVSADNPYCKAIEYLKLKGVFAGYPDGTFRPYGEINRAETTKVILLAIGISIMNDDGSNLGFWDVIRGSWYMSYLRTAQKLGIIRGYPDGSFRPTSTVNRVELLKIFLESTGINIPYCNTAPYSDTPVNADTRWYIDYVCFAANNGLMYADGAGHFNPAAAMTRGDVAELFYQFYVRNMYDQVNLSSYAPYYDNYNATPYYYVPVGTTTTGNLLDNVDVSNTNFDPTNNETSQVCFDILQNSTYTTVEVMSGSSVIRTLADNVKYNAVNNRCFTWNGKNKSGSTVSNGTYKFRVTAERSGYDDTASANVQVDRNGSSNNDLIDNIDVTNSPFDPTSSETSSVCFDLLQSSGITIDVMNGSTVILTIVQDVNYNKSNNRCFSWNGRNKDNNYVSDGIYKFRVTALKNGDEETLKADVEVNR